MSKIKSKAVRDFLKNNDDLKKTLDKAVEMICNSFRVESKIKNLIKKEPEKLKKAAQDTIDIVDDLVLIQGQITKQKENEAAFIKSILKKEDEIPIF